MSGFPDLSDTRRGQVRPVTQSGLGHRRPGPGQLLPGHWLRPSYQSQGSRQGSERTECSDGWSGAQVTPGAGLSHQETRAWHHTCDSDHRWRRGTG